MQSQLFAALASCSKKARQPQVRPRRRGLQPFGGFTQTDGLDFTFNPPWATGFDLFRLMSNDAFRNRHAGRGVTQRLALDQCSREFDAVQLSLGNQFAGAGWTSASAAGCSSWASIIERDFSSFIIGEGVVTARFILMVR